MTVYLFNLDGTLIAEELLPLIAREVGLETEVAELTRATMDGEVPFDASFRRRVAMLADVPPRRATEIIDGAPVLEDLLDWVIAHREQSWVVTGNLDCWVSPWLQRHGLRAFTSKAVFHRGSVEVGQILRKESVLARFPGDRTVMVGGGANDAQIISQASVGIASAVVHDVSPVVLKVADYIVMNEEVLCRTLSRL